MVPISNIHTLQVYLLGHSMFTQGQPYCITDPGLRSLSALSHSVPVYHCWDSSPGPLTLSSQMMDGFNDHHHLTDFEYGRARELQNISVNFCYNNSV